MNEIDAFNLVKTELDQTVNICPKFNSPHEGYAKIKAKLDIQWDHIKYDEPQKLPQQAAQVAAMAIQFLIELC